MGTTIKHAETAARWGLASLTHCIVVMVKVATLPTPMSCVIPYSNQEIKKHWNIPINIHGFARGSTICQYTCRPEAPNEWA